MQSQEICLMSDTFPPELNIIAPGAALCGIFCFVCSILTIKFGRLLLLFLVRPSTFSRHSGCFKPIRFRFLSNRRPLRRRFMCFWRGRFICGLDLLNGSRLRSSFGGYRFGFVLVHCLINIALRICSTSAESATSWSRRRFVCLMFIGS
jgi:hypothetical protein